MYKAAFAIMKRKLGFIHGLGLFASSVWFVDCFQTPQQILGKAFPSAARSATNTALSVKSTLTDETDWKLRIVLRGVATKQGKKVDEIFSLTAQFLEDEGYEPPQGELKQLPGEEDRLKIVKGRWKLSEDPNDRKDGLWVWGLFKEPLYPYMLLQLQTDAVPLPSSLSAGDEEEPETVQDAIKPLSLYAQINHKRDSELGVILEASDLKVRQTESISADPFGAAKVDIFEEVDVGTLSVQPLVATEIQ